MQLPILFSANEPIRRVSVPKQPSGYAGISPAHFGWASFWILITLILAGCSVAPIKVPPRRLAQLQNILIVPVETPPLVVIPDPIETRMPDYRHLRNMSIDVPLQQRVYIHPGDILIEGLVSNDDTVGELRPASNVPFNHDELTVVDSHYWLPSLSLANILLERFVSNGYKARLSSHYHRLTGSQRDTSTDARHAVLGWFEQPRAHFDYGRLHPNETFDAVLEIGIGTYKIFEGQTHLQVLLKMIDPNGNNVIARTRVETFSTSTSAETLLDRDGLEFKRLIDTLGARLIDRGLANIGLPMKRGAMLIPATLD